MAKRTFFEKTNDIRCRGWLYRITRFARNRAHLLFKKGLWLSNEPRIVKAWREGWEPDHYVHLLRWRDEGFRPQVVFDIGANEGAWSAMCQAVFAPEKIFLFEPQPQMAESQRAWQRQAGGTGWQLMPFALGEKEETQTLHLTENRAASSLLPPSEQSGFTSTETRAAGAQIIEVKTLDGLLVSGRLVPADLVKIDVQGYEGCVLAGGREVLSRAQRLIVEVSLREIYQGQPLMTSILQTLNEWGFVLEDLTETFRGWPDGRLWQVDLWMKRK